MSLTENKWRSGFSFDFCVDDDYDDMPPHCINCQYFYFCLFFLSCSSFLDDKLYLKIINFNEQYIRAFKQLRTWLRILKKIRSEILFILFLLVWQNHEYEKINKSKYFMVYRTSEQELKNQKPHKIYAITRFAKKKRSLGI